MSTLPPSWERREWPPLSAQRGDVSPSAGGGTEAREGEHGVERPLHTVHGGGALDRALAAGARGDGAALAHAGARWRPVVEPVVAVAPTVRRLPVPIVGLSAGSATRSA
eukprot:6848106-Prymnesium_polylepis.1